jgi:pimeloyl-ACP methyl ester carboxylesterase
MRTRETAELARTMAAAQALGLDRFNLMGTSFGGRAALWLGLQKPERVWALVLVFRLRQTIRLIVRGRARPGHPRLKG